MGRNFKGNFAKIIDLKKEQTCLIDSTVKEASHILKVVKLLLTCSKASYSFIIFNKKKLQR